MVDECPLGLNNSIKVGGLPPFRLGLTTGRANLTSPPSGCLLHLLPPFPEGLPNETNTTSISHGQYQLPRLIAIGTSSREESYVCRGTIFLWSHRCFPDWETLGVHRTGPVLSTLPFPLPPVRGKPSHPSCPASHQHSSLCPTALAYFPVLYAGE